MKESKKAEIRKMVKQVNDSLYRLEKRGLQEESKEYQMIEKYAVDKGYKGYNVNIEKGTIRATKDLSRFESDKELYEYKQILKNILNAQTRTVSGTKKALKKSYEKFRESDVHKKYDDLSFDKYREIFKKWRTNVSKDMKQKFDSSGVINMIEMTNLSTLPIDEVEKVFDYIEQDGLDETLDNYFKETETGFEYKG